jgi:tetratricopeptide (TPR) repeat protein
MRIMKSLHRIFLLLSLPLLVLTGTAAAEPMTWQEHREAARAQLGYQLADPVTPVEHLERALELARSEKASPAEIGDLMDRLAEAHSVRGASAEKLEGLLLPTLRYKEKSLGEYAPELVPTLRQLSSLRFREQRNLEALQLEARAVTIRVRHFGADSPEAAEEYSVYGLTFESVGELEQAEALLRKAVGIVRGVPNPPDEILFPVLADLAEFLHKTGRIEESEALRQEMSPAIKRVLEKNELEAKQFEHLRRAPSSSDIETLTEEDVAAAVAAGRMLVGPPSP